MKNRAGKEELTLIEGTSYQKAFGMVFTKTFPSISETICFLQNCLLTTPTECSDQILLEFSNQMKVAINKYIDKETESLISVRDFE